MSVDYLFSLEQIGIKLGLDQIRSLVAHLGHPDRSYRSIVVAGTNGKGSVTAMLERGLRAAGYKTGRYTSPHLVQLEERFVIDGQQVSAADLEAAAERVRAIAGRLAAPPSFFEATTAVALDLFRWAAVDAAVLEVGLGGRLDATNVVTPVGIAITAIDFDHQEYLGHTVEAIAHEKAGVIKAGSVVVLGHNPPAVQKIVQATCVAVGASYAYAPEGVRVDARLVSGRTRLTLDTACGHYEDVDLALRGHHQVDNAVTAVRLLEELSARRLFDVPATAVDTALSRAEWPARLEFRRWQDTDVLLDGAHNPAGARALASYVRESFPGGVPFVLGAMRDKDLPGILGALTEVASTFVFTAAPSPRAATPDELLNVLRAVAPGITARTVADPMTALAEASRLGRPVVVAGSLYLCGAIRAELS